MSVNAESIIDWLGEEVVDPEGHRVGRLADVYVDTSSDEPVFAVVKLGLLTSQRHAFVPLRGATVAPRHVRVAYSAALVRKAPALEPGGVLPVEAEVDVYNHYGLEYTPAETPGGRRLARR
ncbi:PRC-barrel domain-containing protein [Streptomyces silvisoli]|uniref:PRC-barrel domain-containing protein n=1 Tax=Streptomyces silvisoli TaxID=3034235 RepID=A0ABT5ZJ28_9ACTN|nr:PRC-barrel domain-containing protein [Streptomyces silvisoli]MDF3289833.1 PRC-barrel domain-containing protein [Streptomyces silvisoli]